MMHRIFASAALLLAFNATAKQPAAPRQCSRPMSETSPWVVALCDHINGSLRRTARARGVPIPSRRVFDLPPHGSKEAERTGLSCLGGLGFVRLDNGWKQLLTADRSYVRCRGVIR